MIKILYSGGLDSTVLAYMAHALGRLHSLCFVSYGQPADSEELGAALYLSATLGVQLEHIHQPMGGLYDMNNTQGPKIVRGRNLLLIAMAANHAAAQGVSTIWYGATAEDIDYIDCSPKFLESAAALVAMDTGIIVEAPLITMSKQMVLAQAIDLGVDMTKIWWCYTPNFGPCGVCNSCKAHPTKVNQ